ncbi:hypothetical protein [Geothrix fuzhouensis]|uniref:hypothetical protein n=1 Tax=Geothrix fuzhouensis TaxID=2966451 RepID=UPI0021490AE5|nr:hypothetical protein [Geothrix fuzhouensis]
MRLRALSPLVGLLLSFASGLQAQVEPQLATKTDLLDVYQKDSGKPEMIVIYDFTSPSRGVFEPAWYMTSKTHAHFIGGNQGVRTQDNHYVTVFGAFKSETAPKDFGMAFGIRSGAVFSATELLATFPNLFSRISDGSGGLQAAYQNIPTIRMWTWPTTANRFKQGTPAVPIHGVPLMYDAGQKRMVPVNWNSGDTVNDVISRITHVRFRITGDTGISRTVDLPCPTILADNPAAADSQNPRIAADPNVKNFQRRQAAVGSDTVVYDPWSDGHLTNSATSTLTEAGVTDTIIGNFFYSFDYLSFIYGSTIVRNASSTGLVTATTALDPYMSNSGYAVPGATESLSGTLTTYPVSGTTSGEGWNNGLPVMTRYQAVKYVSTNVLLDKDGAINWVYRFLAPAYPNNSIAGHPTWTSDDGDSPEELGNTTGSFPPANDGSRNSTKLRYLRRLVSSDLKAGATSLQNMGPSNYLPASPYNPMDMTNFGSFKNVDPKTPQPWAYALANTYYRVAVERPSLTGLVSDATSVFDDQNTSCPGKTFVVAFPTAPMNDSITNALDAVGTSSYYTAVTNGNSDLTGGSYTALSVHPVSSLVPGQESFFPGVLASTAAFRKNLSVLDTFGPNGDTPWGAPWNIGSDPHQAKIQTMVVSIAIPGAYKFQSDNSGRNSHEWYFRVAQWADPYRTDAGYGRWRSANGNPDDYPITDVADNGKVRYYPSADPAALKKNFDDLANYIVAARATLSAPATPSTGARTTTQAYFGIFKTQQTTPVWSGNLFAVGIARTETTDAAGIKRETFTFYGSQGEDTRAVLDATTNPIKYGISDFDHHHLWSAYDIFGVYNTADVALDRPVYTNGVLGNPLLWSSRTVYTIDPLGTANALVSFNSGNTTLTGHLQTYLGASATEVANFIDFIRGKNTNDSGATNRIDIMGDIINSAPLAVELSKDRISGAMLSQWSTFQGAPTTWDDLHARLLMVGTNMGQFHCFGEVAATGKADTSDANGVVVSRLGKVTAYATELWSFIPQDVLRKLYEVYVNRGPNGKHAYLVDGDPVLYFKDMPSSTSLRGDTRVSAGEDAVAVFGERKGGRSYWALAISGSTNNNTGASPTNPLVAWSVQPLLSSDPAIKTMGMSSSVPTFATVKNGTDDVRGTPAVFLGGGYANNEVNARYRALGTITSEQGMGQLILALNPLDGSRLKLWDFKDDAEAGAIGGGVTPVQMFLGDDQTQRIYWADYKGNISAIGSTLNTGAATGFRLDYSDIKSWGSPRFLRRASKNATVPQQRFTNKPEAFKLSTGFPVYVTEADGTQLRPVTVMVAAGAGDRNNPTDADESMSISGYSAPAAPPTTDRLYVIADRQDSAAQSLDANGILDSDLQLIDDNTAGTAAWATSYSDPRLDSSNATYLWKNHNGYYFSLLNGTLPGAYGGNTHDKLLVSPLAKEGALFLSLFSIKGNTGFDCSSNQFTRTFRECDILRPLALRTQVEPDATGTTPGTVGNTDDANRGDDSCNGLAFYFNSLSSQLTDAGDRVVQGGAISSKQGTFNAQIGENTPDIKAVKDTSRKPGFRLRTWRIVR